MRDNDVCAAVVIHIRNPYGFGAVIGRMSDSGQKHVLDFADAQDAELHERAKALK